MIFSMSEPLSDLQTWQVPDLNGPIYFCKMYPLLTSLEYFNLLVKNVLEETGATHSHPHFLGRSSATAPKSIKQLSFLPANTLKEVLAKNGT